MPFVPLFNCGDYTMRAREETQFFVSWQISHFQPEKPGRRGYALGKGQMRPGYPDPDATGRPHYGAQQMCGGAGSGERVGVGVGVRPGGYPGAHGSLGTWPCAAMHDFSVTAAACIVCFDKTQP